MSKRTKFRAFRCRLGIHRWLTIMVGLYEHQACRDCPALRMQTSRSNSNV